MESPCTLVCSIDRNSGYCFGCGRTSDEIGAWTLYSAEERERIMEKLPERLETVERRPRRETRRRRVAQKIAKTSPSKT
ncbi:DUF1289 domain-containing protein [Oricola cellulosilytica]|uniref:DUF1289 domain-containing protein n=1 Tax=Oricola cellulosilytica TaxID=1429082 RepID=A0A4R0P548_9HYPH|nr:DUF1289 domain-containing protein [Oricola cellulosilytica]TCD11972.1 DUF1289 domain-containing protein [Oricola cellulosilytica]